ncbi:50S ribosomal protein L6 [Chloracidobacterium validum]|uniref:50S ribosomal protein L6 n=1 Tax=Chloracidobacterium validum TaxID=2821543 RepID=A0ABX8B9Y0_9BACT|nr:50S ribosomal protein L6 [Chloracidobacterium validum]QUW03484.1 50S ribosomal protein L6 [Chloracidobacterium validum]
MSRIGKRPIPLLNSTVRTENKSVFVSRGQHLIEVKIQNGLDVELQNNSLVVVATDQSNWQYQGLTRTLIDNAIRGLDSSFSINLDLVGVGYKVEKKDTKLIFNLGYSHPIEFELPSGIECSIEKLQKPIQQYQTTLTIKGSNKAEVGQVAADLVKLRKPDAYKGKGIRYAAKTLVLKPGKSGGKGGKK